VAGFAIMATGNLLTAAAPALIAAFAAQVLRGLAIPLADTHVTTYLQRTTPPSCSAGSWPMSTAEWAPRQPPATSSAARCSMPPPPAQPS